MEDFSLKEACANLEKQKVCESPLNRPNANSWGGGGQKDEVPSNSPVLKCFVGKT